MTNTTVLDEILSDPCGPKEYYPWDHDLKCADKFFLDVCQRQKRFEIRKDDRPGGYQVGQRLLLREVNKNKEYSGRWAVVRVTYKTKFEQKPGFCVLSIALVDYWLD